MEAEAEDEEVDDLEFAIGDVGQGRFNAVVTTVGCPESEDGVAGLGGFASVGGIRDLQCSEEIRFEAVSDCRWSSRQGLGCG